MRVEADLQDEIIKYLTKKHIWHFRYTASTTFGIPDILALFNGYLIGIEVKRADGKGKSTLLQEETVKSIQENGGLAAIIDDLTDVHMLITCLSNGITIDGKWLSLS